MIISVKLSIAKMLYTKTTGIISKGWENDRKLLLPGSVMDEIETFKLDLDKVEISNVKKLRVKISEMVPRSIVDKIDRYIEAQENPESTVITSLDEFKAALIAYINQQKTKWFWRMGSDNFMLPYLASTVQKVPRYKTIPAYIQLTLVYGSIGNGEGSAQTTSVSFPLSSYKKKDAAIDNASGGYFDVDESELGSLEEGDEKILAEKKPKGKVQWLPLRKILLNANVYYNSDVLKEKYVAEYELWKAIQLERMGKQYISNSMGYGGGQWGHGATSFIEDKKNCKLVVEEFVLKASGNGFPITYNSSQFGYNYMPYHLYVKLYDITKHRDVTSHVSGLIEYKYNKKLLDELIIDDGIKGLINCLVDGKVEMEGRDIIEGKSGGLVILGYGPPGNGKTLTGEIYSEYVEKPLYQIQSSQLGVSIDAIEKKLQEILRRAERWGCILMIDEADTYVFKRGENMVQNAIVGTFLRLLEYYNGILFLTTNRKEIIDEAIMSRVTLAIPYNNPSTENLIKIWKTHLPAFGVVISDKNIAEISKQFPMSGRDVRNTLKLLSKYYKDGQEINVAAIEFVKKYLPSFEE